MHLQTKEMLHLSRLSKTFRAFFTSRNTQFIWKAARENVPELPPLPEDMNEIQYASLLYDAFCHVRIHLLHFISEVCDLKALPCVYAEMRIQELSLCVLGMPDQTLQKMSERIVRLLPSPPLLSSTSLHIF